jgi:DNA invertase Pin-like site-specific DNA recombinase
MKRVALYARVSTKDKGQEVDNQNLQLRKFIADKGWTSTVEFMDTASAKTADRPAFKLLMEYARQGKCDIVLFWSLDRFSREGMMETLQHLQKLTSWGVAYVSYTEQYLDSCGIFKDAILGILATLAKQERIRISERTIAGMERAAAQGKQIGRPKVVFDRDKARQYRATGMSWRVLSRIMRVSVTTLRAGVGEYKGTTKE